MSSYKEYYLEVDLEYVEDPRSYSFEDKIIEYIDSEEEGDITVEYILSKDSSVSSSFIEDELNNLMNLSFFVDREWESFEDNNFDTSTLSISNPEKIFYQFLTHLEAEIAYFYLHGFSQKVIAAFLDISPALVSYYKNRLFNKLKSINDFVIPIMSKMDENMDFLVTMFDPMEMKFLRILFVKMTQSFVKKKGIPPSVVIKLFDKFISRIYVNDNVMGLSEVIDSKFEWGRMGRDLYEKHHLRYLKKLEN